MKRVMILCAVVTVLVLGAFACGSESAEPQQLPPPISPQSTAASLVPAAEPTPVSFAVVDSEPAPFAASHDSYAFTHSGAATASLEERIFAADVVVRARLVSTIDTGYTFTSVRYLKGTGPANFTVRADINRRTTQWDNQDAILFLTPLTGETADFEFANTTTIVYFGTLEYATTTEGNYVLASGERIPSHLPNGERVPSHVVHEDGVRLPAHGYGGNSYAVYSGDLNEGYSVSSRNPVWLPVVTSSSQARSDGVTPPKGGSNVITEYDSSSGVAQTVSESEFQNAVSWAVGPATPGASESSGRSVARTPATTPEGFTAEDVDSCLRYALWRIREERDYIAHFGRTYWPSDPFQSETSSGSGRGVSLASMEVDPKWAKRHPTFQHAGDHGHLFETQIIDPDSDAFTGYTEMFTVRRPLPAGTYEIRRREYPDAYKACEYAPDWAFTDFVVTVTAPPGTLHEALFDPATTTAGVGYLATTSTTTGVLEPAGFSVRGRAITITGLTWRDGRVVLTLDRFGSWLDGFSFVETDGTVGLRLAEVDATKDWTARTLTWQVSEQPWEPGDELMMRMGPIPLPAVRNLTAEANSAGEVVLRWEVAYRAGVSGYRIWRHRPGRDDGPRIYVSDTLSTDTTYTDANTRLPNVTEYSVQAIGRGSDAGEKSEAVRIGGQ